MTGDELTGGREDLGGFGLGPPDVDLDRVWLGVAAQVWRRCPGPASRLTPATARVWPNLRVSSVSSTFMLLLWGSGWRTRRLRRSRRPAPGRERQRRSR